MSFLDKAIASAGIGSAKVETHLDTPEACKGEQITGFINIIGGKIEQKASKVSLVLMTYIHSEDDLGKEIELAKFDIASAVQIKPNTTMKLPFSIVLPCDTPISFQENMIWIETNLDIKMAVDPSSKSYIKVIPHPFMQRIFDILQNDLKFVLTKFENVYIPNNGCHLPLVQEFEFYSLSSRIENHAEMKMIFFVDDIRGLEIVLELPSKASGSEEELPAVKPLRDNTVRILIPKKEFEKSDSYLADFLVQHMHTH